MNARFPLRGGNWNNGSNAGLGALNLNNSRLNANSNIGFRPALDEARSTDLKGSCQCNLEKDAIASAIAETYNKQTVATVSCPFNKIFDFDNLLSAAYSCRKGKTTAISAMEFFFNLEENIIALQNELMWGEYEASPYRHFYVFEPKRRLISAPHFRDRVVHRAIINVIEPKIDIQFIFDSYACRKGKGTHKGADRAQQFIRKVKRKHGSVFALKADIYHYFSSIDHDVLKSIVDRNIPCKKTRNLLFCIIDNSPSDEVGCGIPLGNLTSQLFANMYLNELDRFVKHKLKAKFYLRYMDDFLIIHNSKQQLQDWKKEINQFLMCSLRLKTNSKTQVFPVQKSHGRAVDFLGYRIYSDHRLLRKCSVKRIKTKLKHLHKQYATGEIDFNYITKIINSWLGHAKHADCMQLRKHLFNKPFKRNSHV